SNNFVTYCNPTLGAASNGVNHHTAYRRVVGGHFSHGVNFGGREVLGLAPAGQVFAGSVGATATTHGNPQVNLKVDQGFGAVGNGVDDLALGNCAAYANIHENHYYLGSDKKQRFGAEPTSENCKKTCRAHWAP